MSKAYSGFCGIKGVNSQTLDISRTKVYIVESRVSICYRLAMLFSLASSRMTRTHVQDTEFLRRLDQTSQRAQARMVIPTIEAHFPLHRYLLIGLGTLWARETPRVWSCFLALGLGACALKVERWCALVYLFFICWPVRCMYARAFVPYRLNIIPIRIQALKERG